MADIAEKKTLNALLIFLKFANGGHRYAKKNPGSWLGFSKVTPQNLYCVNFIDV